MTSSGAAAGIGLLSAAAWGSSDFTGGVGARRAPALLIVSSGQVISLLLLSSLCLGMHLAIPGSHDLFCSALGGFEASLALTVFYRALAMGPMGLTATLTGLLTALVPVIFSFFQDGLPTPLTTMGLVMGCAAIWLITHTPANHGAGTPRVALLLGSLAGVGFGVQLILFKMASGGGILWEMTSARIGGVTALLLCLVAMPPKRPWRGFWLTGIAAGLLDSLGSLFYIRATQLGRLDVAAVVCSLYPGGTILLAAVVLREWPTRHQIAGMVLALVAVVLLSI